MSIVTPPLPYRVTAVRPETADTVTVELAPAAAALPRFAPGQFAMVYAFGIGEVPVSVSAIGGRGGDPGRGPHDSRDHGSPGSHGNHGDHDGRLEHTVRAVGAVSAALHRLRPGELVGLRGPYGTGWDLGQAAGREVLVIAGGIGLAPLRPVVHEVLARPDHYGRLAVLVGARTPDDLIYRTDLRGWRGVARVEVTVDRPAPGWRADVGVVTALLDRIEVVPEETAALVCGPEVMIRHTARALLARGLEASRIQVSLERNMRCGTGHCGHCQLGPLLLCRDGPVVGYGQAQPLLAVREL